MRSLALACCVWWSAVANAQETLARQYPGWGIGIVWQPYMAVAFDDDVFYQPFGISNILIPVSLTERITVEPEIGYLRSEFVRMQPSLGLTETSTATSVRMGLGVLRKMRDEEFVPYIGLRGGLVRTKREQISTGSGGGSQSERIESALFGSGVFGGERYFGNSFAVGAEAQLTFTKFGNPRVDPPPASSVNTSHSIVSTAVALTMRLYF